MLKFMERLQKECGGAGEGIALANHGKVFYMRKGVHYKIETIYKQLKNMDWEWCVYHTRVPSVGAKTDKNCHPFKAGNIVLAMNGTESGYAGLAKALDITDTQAVLLSVKKFNLDLFDTLKPLSSNFIGFVDGVPFATSPNNWKSYDIAVDENGAVVIASSLPNEFTDVYKPKGMPFVWKGTEELQIEKKKPYTYTARTYSFMEGFDEETATEEKTTTLVKSWESKFKTYDYSKYYCPECGEIVRGDELIEDTGMKYCPICGEELGFRNRIIYDVLD